jgi:hypothetical protein
MAEIDMENTRDYPSEVMAKPIKLAQKLRSLLLKIIAVEKERADYERSDEAWDDQLEDVFDTFKNEAVSGEAPAVDMLAQIDQLIYSLVDYEPGDQWVDADDVESKEVLKMTEIIKRDSQFHLKNILIPGA